MEEALVTALAQAAAGKRYWLRVPQGTEPPYVVMQRISTVRHYTEQAQTGLVSTRVQVDCYAGTYGAMRDLAEQVRATLTAYRGGGLELVTVDSDRDLPADDAGEVSRLYRRSVDIIVHHREP